MTTAIKHIERAMFMLGVSSPINKADPQIVNECFTSLKDFIAELDAAGHDTGAVIPETADEQMHNYEWSNTLIQSNLAVNIVNLFPNIELPAKVARTANRTMRELRTRTALDKYAPIEKKSEIYGEGNKTRAKR